VAVSQQNSVESIETDAQGLLAKIGSRIDHHVLAFAREQ
jgi:hypothetical protein